MSGQWYMPAGRAERKPHSFAGGVALTLAFLILGNAAIIGIWFFAAIIIGIGSAL